MCPPDLYKPTQALRIHEDAADADLHLPALVSGGEVGRVAAAEYGRLVHELGRAVVVLRKDAPAYVAMQEWESGQ